MTSNNNDFIAIFSLHVANELCKAGYKVDHTCINVDDPNRKVFYFKNSTSIRDFLKMNFKIVIK